MITPVPNSENWLDMTPIAYFAVIATGLGMTLLAIAALPAVARGGHGFGHGVGGHGATFASGRRHGNDSYIKAASDERDKLLNTQIKSICRGC
jgi:hypothetical protein